MFRKKPKILQRCTNRLSTDKLLAEIIRKVLPKIRISLKEKKDNKMTTISTQVTPQSLKLIDDIIKSPIIRLIFEHLEEQGFIQNQSSGVVKSIIIRASVCYLLYRLHDLKKNISIYQRAATLKSSEKTLEKIYLKKYGGSKK